MKQLFENVDPSLIALLDPSVLHTLELQNYLGLFFAVSLRGKRRMIPLRYIRWRTRKPTWVGLDGFAREFPMLMEAMIPEELKEQVRWFGTESTML
jgi:hypothetical protein